VEIITRIDYDHQAFLGWRLEEIAREKAAIIRSGWAVTAAQAAEVTAILLDRASEAGVSLWVHGRDLALKVRSRDLSGQRLDLSGPGWEVSDCFVPLLGGFQSENALLGVAAVKALAASGVEVGESAIREGLARVRWPGRFQVIGGDPWLVLDGAHNPAGAQALAAALEEHFPGVAKTIIVGISSDKDKAGILKALAPIASRMILTASSNPRATSPGELRALLPPSDTRVEVAADISEALSLGLEPPTTPMVCVTGSLFCVADALAKVAGSRDIPCEIEKGADSVDLPF
jgi:dihydrofolate synthase/folylpolyglutamate synthase